MELCNNILNQDWAKEWIEQQDIIFKDSFITVKCDSCGKELRIFNPSESVAKFRNRALGHICSDCRTKPLGNLEFLDVQTEQEQQEIIDYYEHGQHLC